MLMKSGQQNMKAAYLTEAERVGGRWGGVCMLGDTESAGPTTGGCELSRLTSCASSQPDEAHPALFVPPSSREWSTSEA